MRVAGLALAAAACAHHAPVVDDDPAPAPTVVTCYAGTLHDREDFADEQPPDLAASLKLTVSPSFSTITEEWNRGDGPPRIYDLQVDGDKLLVHQRDDPQFEAHGQLYGDLSDIKEWEWGYAEGQLHVGNTYEPSGTHLSYHGGSSTFESVSDLSAELDEVPCEAR